MLCVGEQNSLIHCMYENAMEVLAESDCKSASTETKQENACDLV